MPDILSDEELNALAGEYVLGTLDYDERKGASALLEVDPAFRGIVRIWEKRLGELHLMVETVDPDPDLWERIRPMVFAGEPARVGIAPLPEPVRWPGDELPAAESEVSAKSETPVAETPVAETPAAETPVAETPVVEPPAAETPVTETPPAEAPAAETPASEPESAARTGAELHLAELAALLPPVAGEGATVPPPDSLPVSDDKELQTAEPIERGFVPPPPMIRRSQPAPLAEPVDRSGRGWMAASVILGLLAVVLAGLIGAWRFFPERLPTTLRAYSVLNMPQPPPPAAPEPPAPPPPPPPAPFLE
jgi:hypothetical protein